MDVGVEQFLATELDSMRNADITHRSPRADRIDRLLHRFLPAHALNHGACANAVSHVFDASDALIAALDDDVGCAEFACEFLTVFVSAHGNDPLGAHDLGGQDAEQADRAVARDCNRGARLHVRCVCGEPAGPHYVGERQETGDEVVWWNLRRGDERAVRQWDTQHRRLRPADELPLLAGGLIAGAAVRTRIVGGEERADNELARFDRPDSAADLFDDAAVFMSHRSRLSDGLKAAIGPQVRPANARRGHPDDSVRPLDDRRGVALLETKIAGAVEHSSSHCRLALPLSNPALVARPRAHARTSSMGGAPRYSSSPTCAPHVALLPFSSTSTIERWLMKLVGAAPCQWSSPGSKNTRSPGRITSIGAPRRCTRPMPSVT